MNWWAQDGVELVDVRMEMSWWAQDGDEPVDVRMEVK